MGLPPVEWSIEAWWDRYFVWVFKGIPIDYQAAFQDHQVDQLMWLFSFFPGKS
jgi:hypothetical protein